MKAEEVLKNDHARVKILGENGYLWGRLIWYPKKDNPPNTSYVRLHGQTKAQLFPLEKIELAGETETDCGSDEGITVGLIDSLISIAKVIKERDLSSEAIQEALIDLQNDASVKFVLNNARIVDFGFSE